MIEPEIVVRIGATLLAALLSTGCGKQAVKVPRATSTDTPTAPSKSTDTPTAPSSQSAVPEPQAAPATTDACFAELALAPTDYAESEREHNEAWVTKVRETLLPPEQAESVAGPLAWRAVEALMTRRFDVLASLVGPDGLCLRAAKGASCINFDAKAVARCARSPEKYDFPVDSGEDDPPPLTCAKAMDRVFLTHDFRHPTSINVNCFSEPGRGNNASSVIQRPAALFVDFHVEETSWQSLWLIFDGTGGGDPDFCSQSTACDNAGRRLYLVELMAEYWGI